ncbi:MAG: ABC transporter permease subunit [Planctomycetota bacterium]
MSGRAAQSSGRRTPLSAHGAPGVWLLALALAIALLMIVLLVGAIGLRGLSTFWPRPVELVTLKSGERLYGLPQRTEAFTPPVPIEGVGDLASAIDAEGRPLRRLYRVGNRDLGQEAFRWIPLVEAASIERPSDAVAIERREWGLFVGRIEALTEDGERIEGELGSDEVDEAIRRADERLGEIEALQGGELASLDRELESLRLGLRAQEIRSERLEGVELARPLVRWGRWCGLLAGVVLVGCFAARAGGVGRGRAIRAMGLWCLAGLLLVGVLTEHPWARNALDAPALAARQAVVGERRAALEAEYEGLLARIDRIRAEDARFGVIVRDAEGRLAPRSAASPDEPMLVSQIVRVVRSNEGGLDDRARVYLARWAEFLADEPRASNTEGGIWPVIFGTVVLTLLLAVAVAPLGVVAAVYLREYARQGVLTSLVRISVNNLAGVPSIVYGVFGLGFFCYTLGRYVDTGPSAPMQALPWWFLIGGAAVAVFGALALSVAARPAPGRDRSAGMRLAGGVVGLVWLAAVGLLLAAAATTPYFHGFFKARASEGTPTFGTRGILWASLTLALLTLPVVIVATEEAISAVPRSMREGSFGCGASRWQTIWRIVLPGAGPGILTGMILAMARGAGEVAPLMLVGAVKLAPELPLSGEFPFVHADRSFMHLGFHIYDLGFQSPDAQAAEGLVWSATLVLVMIVFALNLSAFVLRGRLRAKLRTSAV